LFATDLISDDYGEFTIPNLIAGTYDIVVKGTYTLARRFNDISIVAGANLLAGVALPEGDANGDNLVSIEDFLLLSAAFGAYEDDPNYDSAADLDASGAVNIVDFSLLQNNFAMAGE